MVVDDAAIRRRIGQRQHEAHRSFSPLSECHSLELSATKLSLEVPKPPFDLDVDDFDGALENHVGRTQIRRTTHRHLERNPEYAVGLAADRVGELNLPAVPQAETFCRKETDDQPVSDRARESFGGPKVSRPRAAQDPAHFRLRYASSTSDQTLRRAHGGSSRAELAGEAPCRVIGPSAHIGSVG